MKTRENEGSECDHQQIPGHGASWRSMVVILLACPTTVPEIESGRTK